MRFFLLIFFCGLSALDNENNFKHNFGAPFENEGTENIGALTLRRRLPARTMEIGGNVGRINRLFRIASKNADHPFDSTLVFVGNEEVIDDLMSQYKSRRLEIADLFFSLTKIIKTGHIFLPLKNTYSSEERTYISDFGDFIVKYCCFSDEIYSFLRRKSINCFGSGAAYFVYLVSSYLFLVERGFLNRDTNMDRIIEKYSDEDNRNIHIDDKFLLKTNYDSFLNLWRNPDEYLNNPIGALVVGDPRVIAIDSALLGPVLTACYYSYYTPEMPQLSPELLESDSEVQMIVKYMKAHLDSAIKSDNTFLDYFKSFLNKNKFDSDIDFLSINDNIRFRNSDEFKKTYFYEKYTEFFSEPIDVDGVQYLNISFVRLNLSDFFGLVDFLDESQLDQNFRAKIKTFLEQYQNFYIKLRVENNAKFKLFGFQLYKAIYPFFLNNFDRFNLDFVISFYVIYSPIFSFLRKLFALSAENDSEDLKNYVRN